MPITYNIEIDPSKGTAKLRVSSEGLMDQLFSLDADALTQWQGTDRVIELKPGGGHWETSSLGGLTTKPGGVEVEADHLLVHSL